MRLINSVLSAATLLAVSPLTAGRIYGYDSIRRMLQQQKRDHGSRGRTSIADRPHKHSQEAARRLRQRERVALNRRDRCIKVNAFGERGQIGLSRRGNVLIERGGVIRHVNGKAVS